MQQILRIEFFNVLKIILLSPLAGWIFTICLFEIMQKVFSYQFPKGSMKRRKIQCWIYLSLCVFGFVILIKIF